MTHDSARTRGIEASGPIGETQRLTAAKVQEVVQRAQQTGVNSTPGTSTWKTPLHLRRLGLKSVIDPCQVTDKLKMALPQHVRRSKVAIFDGCIRPSSSDSF